MRSMCGRARSGRTVAAAMKNGRSPGSGEISVTDPKYRQNMIANKFIFACALTDFGDAGGDSSSLP